MARRLITSATTDANGVATISYTGTGVGKMQIVAEVTVTSGTYTSDPFELNDYIVYDHGVTGDKSSDWTTGSAVTVSVSDTGTTLSVSAGTQAESIRTSTKALTGNFELLVNVQTGGENMRWGLTDGTYRAYLQGLQTTDRLFRFRRVSTTITVEYSNDGGETWTSTTWNGNNLADNTADLYFFIGGYHTSSTARTVTYHDLKAYYI